MLYFAFGSNLYDAQMAERCPSREPVGRALLPGYRLTFAGWSRRWAGPPGDVRPDPGAPGVWGFLYHIPNPVDVATLDRCEAVGRLYQRVGVTVLAEGDPARPAEAQVYRLLDVAGSEAAPSAPYLERILAGARAHGLPAEWIATIAATAARLPAASPPGP